MADSNFGAIGSGLTISTGQTIRRNAANNAFEAVTLGTLATQSGTFSGTSSGTNTGDQTTVSGNSGTATALQNARTINGVSFDGTGNITLQTMKSVRPIPREGGSTISNTTYATNTRGYFAAIIIPFAITVNQITIETGTTVTVAGTIQIGIYSEDGQTKYIDVTSPTLSAGSTVYATSVSGVTLQAGNYYLGFVTKGTTNLQLKATSNNTLSVNMNLNSKQVSEGFLDGLTAGTLPLTFDPTVTTFSTVNTLLMRLDN